MTNAPDGPGKIKRASATAVQQQRIREQLAAGTLPRVLPTGATIPPAGPAWRMAGRPRVAPCDACDEVGVTRPIAGFLWHEGCYLFWQAETMGEARP
jgi:hypothetical protein